MAENSDKKPRNNRSRKSSKKQEAPRRAISRTQFSKNIREITGESRQRMKWQTVVIWIIMAIFLVLILLNLYNLTVVEYKNYTELAARTHTRQANHYPDRGNIYAANGTELAVSTYTYTIGVSPDVFGPRDNSAYTKDEVIDGMAQILEIDADSFRDNLEANAEAVYMVVKRNIDPAMNDALNEFIAEARISGVATDANQARYYPGGSFASNVLGFANKTDQQLAGVSGIELSYNDLLSGQTGYSYSEVDNYWRQNLPGSLSASIPAVDGSNLRLTIQEDVQTEIERLVDYMEGAYQPDNGSQIIVVDTTTGGIIAYSSSLRYDLNSPTDAPTLINSDTWNPGADREQQDYMTGTVWSNQAVRFPYEVGSVLKPFVYGMGFDEGILDRTMALNDEPITVAGWTMSSYDNANKGYLSVPETLWDSRNPAFVRLAQDIGMDDFYSYIDLIGARSVSGVDLPNEVVGLFHTDPQPIDMAVTSFGEQVTMTLMQLVNSYLAMANDGQMITPHFADAILDDEGNVVSLFEAEVKRQIFSKETTSEILDMMIGVGRYGTARPSYFPGVEVAYKTGTSSKDSDGDGRDDLATYNTVSLMPANDPKYLVITVSHDVEISVSAISHKINGDIQEFLAKRDNFNFNYKAYDYNLVFSDLYTRNIIGSSFYQGARDIAYRGMHIVSDDEINWTSTINSQYPVPGYLASFDADIWVSEEANDLPENFVQLPDFTGMTAFEARELAKSLNLNVKLTGSRRAAGASSQSILNPELAGGSEPGDMVREYSQIILHFDEGEYAPEYDDSIVAGKSEGYRY